MRTKIDLNNLHTRSKWEDYLGKLRLRIMTDDGIIVLDEPLKRKWLKHRAIENKVREKFKTTLALEKLKKSNE